MTGVTLLLAFVVGGFGGVIINFTSLVFWEWFLGLDISPWPAHLITMAGVLCLIWSQLP